MTLANNQFIRIRKGYHGTYFQLAEYVETDGPGNGYIVEIYERYIERKRLMARDRSVQKYIAFEAIDQILKRAEDRRTRRAVEELVQVAFEMNGGKGEAEGRVMRPF